MPKAIKVKCFILFFAVFIVIGRTEDEFDYLDCGSSLNIKTVSVSNCNEVPCNFSPGDHFTVEITLSEVNNLNRTELVTEAYIWMYGAKWSMEITPINPCSQWNCPVYSVDNLKYTADVHIADNMVKRPAHVEVVITYDMNGENYQALCIEFNINLQ